MYRFVVLLGCTGHVRPIDMKLSVGQLFPDCRPNVQTQPVNPISVRRVLPGPDCHEVLSVAERLSGLNSCEERSHTKLVVGNVIDVL